MAELEDKSIKPVFFERVFGCTALPLAVSLFILITVRSAFSPQSVAAQTISDQTISGLYLPVTVGSPATVNTSLYASNVTVQLQPQPELVEGVGGLRQAQATGPERIPNHAPSSVSAAAINAAPTIEMWYGETQDFGQRGTPQQWINLLGNVSPTEGLTSIAPAPQLTQLDYELNGVKASDHINLPRLNLGPGLRRVYGNGDFNLEIDVDDLNNGANTIIISATNNSGTTAKNVALNYDPSTTWPLPYTTTWNSIANIADVHEAVQIVDGKWKLENDGLRTDELGYDRIVAIGDQSWTEYEAVVPITIHGVDESIFGSQTSLAPGIGLVTRWEGHTNNPAGAAAGCLVAHCGYLPQGANPFYGFDDATTGSLYMAGNFDDGNGGVIAELSDPQDRILEIGTTYLWKVRIENIVAVQPRRLSSEAYRNQGGSERLQNVVSNQTRYSFKLWEEGQPEPLRFQMSGIEQTGVAAGQTNGSLLFVAHHVDATLGQVVVTTPPIIPTHQLTTTVVGGGSIVVDPIYADYIHTEPITLTAVPSIGWRFVGWTGDLSSTVAQEHLVVNSDKRITATFAEVTTAPISVTYTGAGSGSVRLAPNQALYNLGDVVQVTALPTQDSQFDGWDGDLFDAGLTNPTTMTVQLNNNLTAEFGPNLSGILSDDFNRCTVADFWTYEAGLSDVPLAPALSGTSLALTAPGGAEHYGADAVRLMQSVNDVDFEVEVKFNSSMDAAYQTRGLVVEDDFGGVIRFEFFHDGGSYNIFIADEENNALVANQIIAMSPTYIRLARLGSEWIIYFSATGNVTGTTNDWGSLSFNHDFEASRLGVFVGNTAPDDAPFPDHFGEIDYFYNRLALGAGDQATDQSATQYPVNITSSGGGTVEVSPDFELFGCGQTISLMALPGTGKGLIGWSGDLTGSATETTLLVDGPKSVTATFGELAIATLTTNKIGEGAVVVTPSVTSLIVGQLVEVEAFPAKDWRFDGWSDALTGPVNPAILLMDGDKTLTANFSEITTFQISSVVTGSGMIQIEPALEAYPIGQRITVTAVSQDNGQFSAWGGDLASETSNPILLTVDGNFDFAATFGTNESGIRSDDFNQCALADFWTYKQGLATPPTTLPATPSISGLNLALSVPAGTEHYAEEAVRLMQPANNVDFEVEVKFGSGMEARYQTRGIILESPRGETLRFEFLHDGDAYSLFVAPESNPNGILFVPSIATPTYIRLLREGSNWSISFSENGSEDSWHVHNIGYNFTVSRIGLFAGNTGDLGGTFPAHTAIVDYFHNGDAISGGDTRAVELYTLDMAVSGGGTIMTTPVLEAYGCGQPVILTAVGNGNASLMQWSGDIGTANSGSNNSTITIQMDGNKSVVAQFGQGKVYLPFSTR